MSAPSTTNSGPEAVLLPRIQALRTFVQHRIPARFQHLISADDILQEVWIRAARTYRVDQIQAPATLERWLRGIATSRLIDALRAARQVKRGGDRERVPDAQRRLTSCAGLFARLQAPGRSPSRDAHVAETGHTILILLNTLKDEQRQALVLRYVDGLSGRQIAAALGKSEAAVNSLLYHARQALRTRLGSASKYFSDARSTAADNADESW